MNQRRPPSSQPGGPRCLIWIAPGYDMPLDLIDGLRQRDIDPREVHHAPMVMAELATGSPGYDVLVIVDPAVHPEISAVVGAVEQYFPQVRIWRYDRNASVRLARWNGRAAGDRSAAPRARPEPARCHAPQAGGAHAGQPAAEPSAPGRDVPGPAEEARPPHGEMPPAASAAAGAADGLLSEAELAMLLGRETFDDPDAESPEPGPASPTAREKDRP